MSPTASDLPTPARSSTSGTLPRWVWLLLATPPLLALFGALGHIAWTGRSGPLFELTLQVVDISVEVGLDPDIGVEERLQDVAQAELGVEHFPRYLVPDNLLRVILLWAAPFCLLNAWLHLRGRAADPRRRLDLAFGLMWLLLVVVQVNGAIDVGIEVEVFGGDDVKHVVYVLLAAGLGLLLAARYPSAVVILPYGIALILHADYIASELWPHMWGDSRLASLLHPAVFALTDDAVQHARAAFLATVDFDTENAFGKNFVAAGYAWAYMGVSAHLLRERAQGNVRPLGA